MQIMPYLIFLGLLQWAQSDPLNIEIQKDVASYEAHHSSEYLNQFYVSLFQKGKVLKGFATFHFNRSNLGDSGRYQGFECHWLILKGKKVLPQNTDSLFINGILGIPRVGLWFFAVERGPVTAYSLEPNGEMVKVSVDGREYPLENGLDRNFFREKLKKIPEAYLLWAYDPKSAIAYYNQFQGEAVQDLNYEEPANEIYFPNGDVNHPLDYEKRITKNANDMVAIGKRAQFYCEHEEYDKAYDDFRKMDRIHPDQFRTLLLRGFCLTKRGKFKEANDYYYRAAAKVPASMLFELYGAIEKNEGSIVKK